MGYRVHREDDMFKVVEVNNGETKEIANKMKEDKAKKLSRALNFGGGFDGKTPDFFLAKLATLV